MGTHPEAAPPRPEPPRGAARSRRDVYQVQTGAIGNRRFAGRIIEFSVLPEYRTKAVEMFAELLHASGAQRIEAQTNVPLMTAMLREFGTEFGSENILFADGGATARAAPDGAVFRRRREMEELTVFEHRHEPAGDWVIEADGEIVATARSKVLFLGGKMSISPVE